MLRSDTFLLEVNTGGGPNGIGGQSINPYELSFDIGYSRKLSDKFSMGVVFRYIYSDLGFPESDAEAPMVGASAFRRTYQDITPPIL